MPFDPVAASLGSACLTGALSRLAGSLTSPRTPAETELRGLATPKATKCEDAMIFQAMYAFSLSYPMVFLRV